MQADLDALLFGELEHHAVDATRRSWAWCSSVRTDCCASTTKAALPPPQTPRAALDRRSPSRSCGRTAVATSGCCSTRWPSWTILVRLLRRLLDPPACLQLLITFDAPELLSKALPRTRCSNLLAEQVKEYEAVVKVTKQLLQRLDQKARTRVCI